MEALHNIYTPFASRPDLQNASRPLAMFTHDQSIFAGLAVDIIASQEGIEPLISLIPEPIS